MPPRYHSAPLSLCVSIQYLHPLHVHVACKQRVVSGLLLRCSVIAKLSQCTGARVGTQPTSYRQVDTRRVASSPSSAAAQGDTGDARAPKSGACRANCLLLGLGLYPRIVVARLCDCRVYSWRRLIHAMSFNLTWVRPPLQISTWLLVHRYFQWVRRIFFTWHPAIRCPFRRPRLADTRCRGSTCILRA